MNPTAFLRRLAGRTWFRVLAALLILYAAIGFLVLPAVIRGQLPKRLAAVLHREVALARVRVNPFTLSVTLDGFNVKDRDGSDWLGWDRLYVNLSTASLIHLAPVFDEIRLEGFHARVALDKQGNPNFQDLLAAPSATAKPASPSGPPPELRIHHLAVVGARVAFIDQATAPAFTTTLGPLSLDLEGFRLSRDNRNPYSFAGRTERGETFGWQGQFQVEPLRSQGSFYISNFYLPKYAPFYRDSVAFAILDGALDFKAGYDLQWGEGSHAFRLHQGEAGLNRLQVGEAGTPGAAVDLPEVRLRGLEADLLERWAKVASLSLKNGKLEVRRDADGKLNLQRMAATRSKPEPEPAKPFRFDLDEFRIENQTLAIEDRVPSHPVKLTLDQMGVTVKQFSLDPAKRCSLDLDLRWNGAGRLHAGGPIAPMKATGALDLQGDALDLPPFSGYLEPAAHAALAAGRLGFKGHLDFDAPAGKYGFTGQARIDGFKALDEVRREPLVGWESLRAAGIKVATAPTAVSVASLDWDAPSGRYVMTPKPAAPVAAAVPPPAPAEPAAANPMKLELGVFRIKRGAFAFIDRTIQPVAAINLDAIEGQVGRLTSDPAARADLALNARLDGAAPLKITGTVNLLSQAAFTDLKVTMAGWDLSPLSPYASHYVGYGIQKGKLEVDLNYKIQERRLQAENHLRMDQFTLGDAFDGPDVVHLPIRLGLALLRDRNGMIDLDVPVGGDLSQPDFKLSRVIWHAVLNLFTKIVTSPFSLLGKVFGGGDSDLSLVAFAPGADSLDAPATKTLATLEKGLFERPGLRLEMEGSASDQDVPALKHQELEAGLARLKGQPVDPQERPRFLREAYLAAFPPPKPAKDAKPGKDHPAPPEPSPAEMEAKLLERITELIDPAALKLLARRRVQAARDHLLKGGKVEEGRVFIVDGGERAKKEAGAKVFFELK